MGVLLSGLGVRRVLRNVLAMNPDRLADDEKLDETLRETFPASDAPANTVETGIKLEIESSPEHVEVVVRDTPASERQT